jgi:hypothetical protein
MPWNLINTIKSPSKKGGVQARWVACSIGGSIIAYSLDGNNWTAAASTGGISQCANVAYGNGLWVAVGAGSLIAYSSDGNNWTASATKGGITTNGRGVAYGTNGAGVGRWVAVGEGGIIAYSSDGNNWTAAATKGGLGTGYGVAFNPDII